MATKKPERTPDLLARVRRICAKLPGTEQSSRLGGEPHFYVGGKIFCGCGTEDGAASVGMKVGLDLQAVLITRPGFRVAKYVGKHGWINVDDSALADDAELERLIRRSYDLITGAAGDTARPKRAVGKAGAARSGAKRAARGTRASGAAEATPAAGVRRKAPRGASRGRR